ncbi:hypothetical protein GCM10009104_08740 [Marinobacterium maritimum]|uniref:Uncharacterized protein n=1 Tax=Marinobacterium maritimum TaxID=500162 RepID=A0ABN1I3E8_9GAMM
MENRIPLPTDSLYKFCALFGTLIVIFSFGALLYVNKAKNDLVFSSVVRLGELQDIQSQRDLKAAEIADKKSIERMLEIAGQDHDTHVFLIALGIVVGTIVGLFGYLRWYHKLQRYQDEMMKLEYYKLRREVSKL